MTVFDGAALVAAVALVGTVALVIGRRLRVTREHLAAKCRAEDRREADRLAAEAARLARDSAVTERGIDDLAEVRAAITAIIARAEAAREPFNESTAA